MKKATEYIPEFDANGNLPPGVYDVTIEAIRRRFAWNTRRRKLLDGLKAALENLAISGIKRVWIDGSFVTDKDLPNDTDGCWEFELSMDADRLDPVFLDLNPPREAMKKKYGVDFLVAGFKLADPEARGRTIQEFFQVSRIDNPKGRRFEIRKGILRLTLGEHL